MVNMSRSVVRANATQRECQRANPLADSVAQTCLALAFSFIAQRPRTGGLRTDEHQDQPHVLIPVHSPRQKTAQDYQVQVLHSAEQYPNQYEICSHPLSLQYELPLLFLSHLLRMLNYIHIVSSVS